MADPAGIIGIRAEGSRPVALLYKDNYRAWSTKLKSQLKVMECWALVNGVELEPLVTSPPNCTPAETAVVLGVKRSWDKRKDRAAAVLITSISDDELHTVSCGITSCTVHTCNRQLITNIAVYVPIYM